MADDAGGEFRRPVPLALAGLAIIGWALAAFLWSQDAQTRTQMTDSLNAAEKARESLAADLQNLQKQAGTAADLKAKAAEAEKTLSDAAAARASAQNELADLTKQINDAKLAISGAQEEASAKSRDLQAVDARLQRRKRPPGRVARPGSDAVRRSGQAAGTSRGRTRRPRRSTEPDCGRPKTVRDGSEPDQLRDGRTQCAASPNPRGQAPTQHQSLISCPPLC